MFLQLLGFLALVALMGYGTLAYLIVCGDGLGKWNIGGVENSIGKRLAIVAGLLFILFLWAKLWSYAPFSFHLVM